MSSFAQPPGGLRPAFAELPPALRPHAILSAAPRPDRRLSLLAAGAIYFALAAGAWLVGRHTSILRPAQPPTEAGKVFLPPEPADPPALPPLPPARAAYHPDAPREPEPLPTDSGQVPPELPADLPVIDRSKQGAQSARDPGTARPPTGVPGVQVPAGTDTGMVAVRDFTADPPRVLHAVNPDYPPMARAARLQGLVELRMLVDERGVPVRVEVLSGHPAFHAEAEHAARAWRFEPARVGGLAVPAQFRLTIAFRLQ